MSGFRSRRRSEEEQGPSRPSTPRTRFSKSSLIFIGLVLGLAGALYYAWVLEPVVYVAASPARLNDRFKKEYLFLVSESYAADGDWSLAQERLDALDDPNIKLKVSQELESYLRRGESASRMRNLAGLARQLGVNSVAIDIFVPQDAELNTPLPTAPPTPARTRPPSRTPAATITSTPPPASTTVPKYRLISLEQICLEDVPAPRIEVEVIDAFLEPEAGVEVIVQWNEGVDHFFTGFQPEKGLGYGDFGMKPDVTYQVYLVEGSPTVDDLQIETCLEREGGWPGGWRLTFQNTVLPEDLTREPDN